MESVKPTLAAESVQENAEQEPRIDLIEFNEKLQETLENDTLSPIEQSTLVAELHSLLDEEDYASHQENLRQEILPEILGSDAYRTFGRELAHSLKNGAIEYDELIEGSSSLKELPEVLQKEVLGRFIDKKLIRVNKNETISLSRSRHAARSLEMGELDTARYVRKIFTKSTESVKSIEDIKRLHQEHDTERKVSEVIIKTDNPGARILPINELRVGHQDGLPGIELVEQWINKLEQTPEEERPGAILVSNITQGDFSHSQSKKRASLVPGLDNMSNQFASAKIIMDSLRKTGIPVIHSLGADDHRIAQDYTMDVIADMKKFAKGDDNHIAYYNQNKLLQAETFQQHKKFQIQYILPLCYRLGRSLRSADEMSEATNGEITRSEYLMLYDHIALGQPLHPSLGLDESSLRGLGEWHDNTVVVDDVDIIFETAGEERTFRYRHVENFGAESLAANHSEVLKRMLGNLGTNAYTLPDATITGRAQEAVYLTSSGVPIVTLPGLTDPVQSIDSSQYYRRITGDASLRANATRKRLWTPTIDDFELADNGDIVHRYINKEFLDKADSLPRTAVFELCDIQKGSPTARSDYYVKFLSYILETAERMPVAVQWAGDIIHGNIYPGFADESQAVGLIKIQSQKLAVEDTLMKAWGHPDIPKDLLDSFIDLLVQQGNHDEVQKKRTPNNHDSNIDYLIRAQKNIFDKPGEPSKVRHNAIFHTSTGTPVPTWMGTTHLGAYSIKTAHYHINGGASGLPLYHPYRRAQGLGEEEKADILLGAHWHNEQSGMIGNKLIVIGGAWAERSQFEDMRGYHAKLAGTVIYLGGGEPPEVRFIHAKNLDERPVKYGYFTPENLADHGFHDDPDFDPTKHAQYSSDDRPKSAIQKALNHLERRASQLVEFEAEIDNPNLYDKNGNPIYLNDATSRAFAQAAIKLSRNRKR